MLHIQNMSAKEAISLIKESHHWYETQSEANVYHLYVGIYSYYIRVTDPQNLPQYGNGLDDSEYTIANRFEPAYLVHAVNRAKRNPPKCRWCRETMLVKDVDQDGAYHFIIWVCPECDDKCHDQIAQIRK
jgi:hypothetical protein